LELISESLSTNQGTTIDYGGYSTVRIAKDSKTGQTVAVKVIDPEGYFEEQFIREVEAYVALNHPCVCRILGWVPLSAANAAEIHMELAENRSLARVLERVRWGAAPRFWTPTGKTIIICGIALGMRFVHSKGYIHRDLKPGNTLINGRGEALISDFGTVRPATYDRTLTDGCGTLHYAAPECFIEDAECTEGVAVFSFGSILYEILTDRAVFPFSMSPFDLIRTLRTGKMPAVPDSCGSFIQQLIAECWSGTPEFRPSFHRIVERFQHADFNIVPQASSTVVRRYVSDILRASN
jgi:serine/threonine-protein kinase